MADLITGIVALLLTETAITSIIAGGNSIQPIPAPVEASLFPAIVYQVVSDQDDMTLTGSAGLAHARILFSCHASFGPGSYLIAHNLGVAVKAALNGYQGFLPSGPQVFFADVPNVTDLFQSDALLSTTNVSVIFDYQS
jgi:hypothetical protein